MSSVIYNVAWSEESDILTFGSNSSHTLGLIGRLDEIRIDSFCHTYQEMLASARKAEATKETRSLSNSTGNLLIASQGLLIKDGVATPATISGYAVPFVDVSDGDLKIKFSDGKIKTIVTDTDGVVNPVSIKTGTYTLLASDYHIIFNSASDCTAYLPTSVGLGINFVVTNVNVGDVYIIPDGSDVISDEDFQIAKNKESFTLIDYSSGKWVII